ncbi:MAG: hypothetical protein QMD04_11655 [Anaerolineales bacterium]|nr:hypothetical protein [Anaerolineales bacterium]
MNGVLPRDFSTVDRKARMKIESRGLPLRPADERIRDFDEAIIRLDDEWAMVAGRKAATAIDRYLGW